MDLSAGWSIFVAAVDGSIRRNDKTWSVGNLYRHRDAWDTISTAPADGATLHLSAGGEGSRKHFANEQRLQDPRPQIL